MKKFLIAIALLLAGASAFAQYGGGYSPKPTSTTFSTLTFGPKPALHTTGYNFLGAAPANNQFTLNQTNNGYTQSGYSFSGTTSPTSILNWGNLNSLNYYLCSKFETGDGNFDCTDQISSPPSGRSYVKHEDTNSLGLFRTGFSSNAAGTISSSTSLELVHSWPFSRIETTYFAAGATRRTTMLQAPNGGVATLTPSANVALESSYDSGGLRYSALGLNGQNATFKGRGSGTTGSWTLDVGPTEFTVYINSGGFALNSSGFSSSASANWSKMYYEFQILTEASGTYTYVLEGTLPDSGSGQLTVTIVDTNTTVTTGDVDICGRTTNASPQKFECETVAITGAGTFDTVNSYYQVVAVKSSGVSVLGGADETIQVTWKAPATGFGPLTTPVNLVNQAKLQVDGNSIAAAYNTRALCTDLSLGCDLVTMPFATDGDRFRFIVSPYGGAIDVADAGVFNLSAAFTGTPNDVLDLVYDQLEAKWIELGRSVN